MESKSQNINYYIKEIEKGDKKLYAIFQTSQGKGGATNDYDLNLYYSSYDEAKEKLESL